MADKTQEQLIDELLKDYTGPESFFAEGHQDQGGFS